MTYNYSTSMSNVKYFKSDTKQNHCLKSRLKSLWKLFGHWQQLGLTNEDVDFVVIIELL